MGKIRDAVKKAHLITIAILAILTGVVTLVLNVFNILDKTTDKVIFPYVEMHITTADMYSVITDLDSSKFQTYPDGVSSQKIPWLTIPTRVEIVNSLSRNTALRDLELAYLTKDEPLTKCQEPQYTGDTNHVGFYTYIVRDAKLNKKGDINTPINISANSSLTIDIDFLTVPLIPDIFNKSRDENMNEFVAFCLRWKDIDKTIYISNIYRPLDYSSDPRRDGSYNTIKQLMNNPSTKITTP